MTATQGMAAPLAYSAAALLPDGKRILISGGESDSETEESMHQAIVYDTQQNQWSVPALKGLPRIHRKQHTATSDNQGRIWIWGGKSKWDAPDGSPVYENSWIIIDTNTWACSKPNAFNPPLPRIDHTATLMPDGNNIIVIGGLVYSRNATDPDGGRSFNPVSMSQLLLYDMSTGQWKNVTAGGNVPAPRKGHTAVLSSDKRSIILFGGVTLDSETTFLNDVFTLELDTMHWSSPPISGVPPPPRQYHQARNINGSMLTLFGLGSDIKGLGDVNVLNTNNWSWLSRYDAGKNLLNTEPSESLANSTNSNGGTANGKENTAFGTNLTPSPTTILSAADTAATASATTNGSYSRDMSKNPNKENQSSVEEETGARVQSGVVAGVISGGVVVVFGAGVFLVVSIVIYRRRKQSQRTTNEVWEKDSQDSSSTISDEVVLFPVSHKPNDISPDHAVQTDDGLHKPNTSDQASADLAAII